MADQEQTSNESFLESLVRHQILLLRLSSGIVKNIVEILNATEDDLRTKIERKVAQLGKLDLSKSSSLKRLEVIQEIVKEVRGAAFKDVEAELTKQMINLSKAEPAFIAKQLDDVLPVEIDYIFPNTQKLKALVTSKPFEGKTMKQWAQKLARDDLDRITQQVKIGIIQGEAPNVISKRLIGTVSMKGKDGVTQVTRNNAAAVARTATNFYANEAKKEFYLANADIIKEELFVATLDARTTAVCRGLDGKRFPLGTGPRPPLHFGCRSIRVAIIDDTVIGERPMNSFTKKEALKEFAQKEGLGFVPKSRDDLPRGAKGAFDQFSAKLKRDLTGRTPATTTYNEFLKKQTIAFQNEVLGVKKAQLFRKGGISLDKFIDRAGNELTLEQLAKRYPDAFRKAGLSAEDFK